MRALALALTACAARHADLPASAPPGAAAADRAVADGLELALTLDAARYTATANGIRCITAPCPSDGRPAVVHATVELRNVGDAPLDLRFGDAQRFELTLLDDRGDLVRAWSEGRAFAMALGTLSLAPGATERWTADLPVADRAGAELAGDFVVRATVVGQDVVADVPVRVDLEGASF